MRYLFQFYPALSVASGAAVTFAAQRYPRLLRIFIVLAVLGATGMLVIGRKGSPPADATRDAVMTARQIQPGERVWITNRTQYGGKREPSVGKALGFYAEPLLRTCKAGCADQATAGETIVTRADEAEQTAKTLNGRIDYSNKTLAIVRIPGAAR
jgi:hypothetical protein